MFLEKLRSAHQQDGKSIADVAFSRALLVIQGNSLGDLVANVTVARMGYPLMALSACFGGPMLNILLGIGISGTYLTRLTQKPVLIAMSTTLLVSGASLLVVLCGTLITVPLNGYVMSRKWALGLIAVYVAVMSANIVVEVRSES